jgi:hypothetical protein
VARAASARRVPLGARRKSQPKNEKHNRERGESLHADIVRLFSPLFENPEELRPFPYRACPLAIINT